MSKDESCLILLAWPFVVVGAAIVNGLALAIMWGWFIVPALHVGSITIPEAIGLSMVVSYLTNHGSTSNKDDKSKSTSERFINASLVAICTPAVVLAMAFIVHLFV
jgi:hypothetical protein